MSPNDLIRWCLEIDHGLRLSRIDIHRSRDYLDKSSRALLASSKVKGLVEWEITTLYYAAYYALYSILLKFGVRSKNHTCTIGFGKYVGLDMKIIEKLKEKRQKVQYYAMDLSSQGLRENTIDFIDTCRVFIEGLDDEKIRRTRKSLGL